MTESAATRPQQSPQRLIDLLSQQQQAYQRLLDMTAQQRQLLDHGQTDALRDLLTSRQQVVDQVVRLHADLEPYQPMVESDDALNADQRGQVGRLIDDIQQLRQRVLADQDGDRRRLQQARGRISEQLDRIRRAGAAISAYRPPSARSVPRLTDRQG